MICMVSNVRLIVGIGLRGGFRGMVGGSPLDMLIILVTLVGICLFLILMMSAHCILLIFIVKTVINQFHSNLMIY